MHVRQSNLAFCNSRKVPAFLVDHCELARPAVRRRRCPPGQLLPRRSGCTRGKIAIEIDDGEGAAGQISDLQRVHLDWLAGSLLLNDGLPNGFLGIGASCGKIPELYSDAVA
jgi:hypothetical protein